MCGGVWILGIGLALLGSTMWWRAAGQQLIWYKPYSMVRSAADSQYPNIATKNQEELVRRLERGLLSNSQKQELVSHVLTLQPKLELEWASWGDVLCAAGTALSPQDIETFNRQSRQFEIRIAPSVASGGDIAFEVIGHIRGTYMQVPHLASQREVIQTMSVRARMAFLDNQPIEASSAIHLYPFEGNRWAPWCRHSSASTQVRSLTVPMAAGQHRFVADFEVIATTDRYDVTAAPLVGNPPSIHVDVPLQVLPVGQRRVEIVVDPKTLDCLRPVLTLGSPSLYLNYRSPAQTGTRLKHEYISDDVAFEASIEIGGVWHPLGACIANKGDAFAIGLESWLRSEIVDLLNAASSRTFRVRLHPSEEVAERSLIAKKVLVGKDLFIEVDWTPTPHDGP